MDKEMYGVKLHINDSKNVVISQSGKVVMFIEEIKGD